MGAESSVAALEPVTSSDLRQLWDEGHRGTAIRSALEGWTSLLGQPDDLSWLVRALRQCGLGIESLAAQLAQTRRRARSADWETLVRIVLGTGDPWWARDLLTEVAGDSRELRALRIEVELALGGDTTGAIGSWIRDHRDEAAVAAAVGWLVRSDRIEDAARLVDEAPGLTRWRARIALWRNRPDVARPLLATLAPDPETRCLDAIALVLEGDLANAEARLRELLDTDVRAEAWTWLATVLRKQRRYAEAIQATDAASSASIGFNLVARLERELSSDYESTGAGPAPTAGSWLHRVAGTLKRYAGQSKLRRVADLENADALYLLGLKPDDSTAALEDAVERFAGNHTVHLSTVDAGKLASCRLPRDPRQLGAIVQLVFWTRGAAATRALYDELAPLVDDHPLYRIYHGELELWMGAYAEAERIFRKILARDDRVRWAWIGLGASLMLQGQLDHAQETWERGLARTDGVPGPTLYVYRGECYRRQGASELARRELETGLRQKPRRLSARINLALLERDPEALALVERECTAFAPLLMEELKGGPAERLEQVLVAMRGNRSSSEWHVSYHLWGRVWRRGTTGDAGGIA